MVAALSSPSPSPSPSHNANQTPSTPNPSAPNAALSRRPRTKDVSSRYLSTSSSSTTTNTSSSTTTSSSSSSYASSRRFPSPFTSPRAIPQTPSFPKRSQSVDRSRPARPISSSSEISSSAAVKALCTTTRSLSVSFQGGSFFYQTSKAKAAAPTPARKPTPERRTASITPSRRDQQDANRPVDLRRWPAARGNTLNPLMRSLDCSLDRKDQILGSFRLLQHSVAFDEGRRASFECGEMSASSDSESVSSGSNSGALEAGAPEAPGRSHASSRGGNAGPRFWQDGNGRSRQGRVIGAPPSPQFTSASATQKLVLSKSMVIESPRPPMRSFSSPLRGPLRAASPCKVVPSTSRAMLSPARVRNGTSLVESSAIGQPGLAPSIISFAAEIRRAKKGENRIEEAHFLRLLHNRHLQWRCVNARATAALRLQKSTAERNMYNAWVATSEMYNSVAMKRIKLQLLRYNLKLTSILKGQIVYLEEWSHMDKDHSSSLSEAIESLKASTIRLPVVSGARAEIQDVKEAVGSAVDVMQAMASSICSLLTKAEGTSTLLMELARVVAQERELMNQAKDLLSTVAAFNVRSSSLRGHQLQLKRQKMVKPL